MEPVSPQHMAMEILYTAPEMYLPIVLEVFAKKTKSARNP